MAGKQVGKKSNMISIAQKIWASRYDNTKLKQQVGDAGSTGQCLVIWIPGGMHVSLLFSQEHSSGRIRRISAGTGIRKYLKFMMISDFNPDTKILPYARWFILYQSINYMVRK